MLHGVAKGKKNYTTRKETRQQKIINLKNLSLEMKLIILEEQTMKGATFFVFSNNSSWCSEVLIMKKMIFIINYKALFGKAAIVSVFVGYFLLFRTSTYVET